MKGSNKFNMQSVLLDFLPAYAVDSAHVQFIAKL